MKRNSPDYNKEYYKKNKKKLQAKARIYAIKNAEKVRKWAKDWKKKNPDKVLANKAKFRIVNRTINKRSIRLTIEILEKILLTLE